MLQAGHPRRLRHRLARREQRPPLRGAVPRAGVAGRHRRVLGHGHPSVRGRRRAQGRPRAARARVSSPAAPRSRARRPSSSRDRGGACREPRAATDRFGADRDPPARRWSNAPAPEPAPRTRCGCGCTRAAVVAPTCTSSRATSSCRTCRSCPATRSSARSTRSGDEVRPARGRRPGRRRLAPPHCGVCEFCRRGEENLCVAADFTGWTVDGGYADARHRARGFAVRLPRRRSDDLEAAPLLCAGVIGYRALRRAEVQPGERVALLGFGASAHLALQVLQHWGCEVVVLTRGEAPPRAGARAGRVVGRATPTEPPPRTV